MARRVGIFRTLVNGVKRIFGEIPDKERFLIGYDEYGNKYYEMPVVPNPSSRKATRHNTKERWVEPADGDKWKVPNAPPEWMTWLQGKRTDAPSVKEREAIYAYQLRTVQRAKEIDAEHEKSRGEVASPLPPSDTEKVKFPTYDELETHPGEFMKKKLKSDTEK